MSDPTNTDYSKFKEDPELLRVLLQSTVEKIIADCWSVNCLTPRLKDLLLTSRMTEDINKIIDTMWIEQCIEKKLKDIVKVEKENPADFIAWRPTTTDPIPETCLKGDNLANQKKILLHELEERTTFKAKLKNVLITKENVFNKYCTKLSDASESIDN